ncbi:hypothetical protein [Tahibacter amnicola]|uniref:Anti sigma-E protein RseA N-terminal domain-containing protein n=1 Tax=Tahibacter amnicola TaxID=2976241 RepID=A0ABY6BDJ5_9GAMM|nr:hypothetical protein [Tahibacter amnicola]UXI67612.1 hypothetical protein N4264_23200 [Tahibacter amnicola]
MTKPSLSQLYREMTAAPTLSARALIDAETAVRASAGRVVPHERDAVAAALAGSAAHADLTRLLRALEPASTDLARSLAHAAPVHEVRERHTRSARGRRGEERGWQWGAIAASLVAAVALFAARSGQPELGNQSVLARMQDKSADEIFSGGAESRFAQADVIYRFTDGEGVTDRIFASNGSGI